MDIDALQTRRFPQPPLAEKEFSLGDWSPGSAPPGNRKCNPLDAFTHSQKEKLLQLRDALLNCMAGVARDTRADNSESSPLGTHNGDAGSDAYDRDFALGLLSQERTALIEIDQALERIESGSYGICEMSGRPIPISRLEAIPFARFTVECQSEMEERRKAPHGQRSIASLFEVADEETSEPEESYTEQGQVGGAGGPRHQPRAGVATRPGPRAELG